MLYITGDTHGFPDRFFTESGKIVPALARLAEEDLLLVAGDFGYLFFPGDETEAFLDRLAGLPFGIAFIDGNHENFPLIFSHPEEEWNGGRVHRIRRNLVHLMRGEIFDLQGHTFFVFGGAGSIDRDRRLPGREWWPEEIPSDEEYRNATYNLARRGREVEYILTHTAPTYIIQAMGYNSYPWVGDGELCGFLEWVARDSDARNYRQWFFGHWHLDMDKLLPAHRSSLESQRFRALMFDMVGIPANAGCE